MKREEKTQQSRRKILDAALREFALRGYGLSSINTICSEGKISKGILYHHFTDKDEIYLGCVQECFESLTTYLQNHIMEKNTYDVQGYFDARISFFKENPLYQKLFCDAIVSPPPHLKEALGESKSAFDSLNISMLTALLKGQKLREGIDMNHAIEVFRLFQDFVNARYQILTDSELDIVGHEEICSRSLNILLYGIVEQGEVEIQ